MRPEIKYLDVATDAELTQSDIPPLAVSMGITGSNALELAAMLTTHGKSVYKNRQSLTKTGYLLIAKAILESDGAHNCGYAEGLAKVGDCTPEQAQQVIDDIEGYLIMLKAEDKI